MTSRRRKRLAKRLVGPIAAFLLAAVPASAGAVTGTVAWVADGDTFRLESGERVRIAGIDSPETQLGQANVGANSRLGRRRAPATARC